MSQKLPEDARKVGRSRRYSLKDTPERLWQWHAPRINRWEKLDVTGNGLALEVEQAAATEMVSLQQGSSCWFAPGERWRVAAMQGDASFELEIYAASKGQAAHPEPLRSHWLKRARREYFVSSQILQNFVQNINQGQWFIAEAAFPISELPSVVLSSGYLLWHPLACGKKAFTAMLAVSERPQDLSMYLRHDHAIIEAVLGGALANDEGYLGWLQHTLTRHLELEERIVFPAYLEAGGHQSWVDGLIREHGFLRKYLAGFADKDMQRKLLRMLDAHDEKEERVVYPDIIQRTQRHAPSLLDRILMFEVVSQT